MPPTYDGAMDVDGPTGFGRPARTQTAWPEFQEAGFNFNEEEDLFADADFDFDDFESGMTNAAFDFEAFLNGTARRRTGI